MTTVAHEYRRRKGRRSQTRKRSGPTIRTPIPPAARPIIQAAHERYLATCQLGQRPCIDDPRCVSLTPAERDVLASCSYYPIPAEVVRLGMTQAEHRLREMLLRMAGDFPDVAPRAASRPEGRR
ncbi:MAG TPA: hypothetical protein VMG10_33460 [Gemmataceae bacterium]|nr:hypothetical protein [Gemmataceae bacterium]